MSELCACGHMKAEHVHVGQAAAGCSRHGCECYVYAEAQDIVAARLTRARRDLAREADEDAE
jgi:hypothetical protein